MDTVNITLVLSTAYIGELIADAMDSMDDESHAYQVLNSIATQLQEGSMTLVPTNK